MRRERIKAEDIKVGDVYIQIYETVTGVKTTLYKKCSKDFNETKPNLYGIYLFNHNDFRKGDQGHMPYKKVKLYKPTEEDLNRIMVENL